jgi:hypothetical protein
MTADLRANASLIVIGSPDTMLSLPQPVAAIAKTPPTRNGMISQAAPLLIVLPNNPTMDYLQNALNLAAMLGQFATSGMDLYIAQAGEVLQQKNGDANLIVLGNVVDQPLLVSLSAGETPILDENVKAAINNPDFGVLREVVSPWNGQRAVLLVYSTAASGYSNAINALLKSVPPVSQSGSLAIVEAGQSPRVIYRADHPVPPPAATPVTISSRNDGHGGTSVTGDGSMRQ